jgi:hypothetical protein
MIRTMVYITEEQARDIKLKARRENKREAEVIRELLREGMKKSAGKAQESTGDALLRLAKLGERLHVKAPTDLSSRIDDYLYGDE